MSYSKKYNLTYPVQFEDICCYFFPYLKTSDLKLGDKPIRKQYTVKLYFAFSFFFPQFFVQRLALEFWRTKGNNGTEIFKNAFVTEIENGVALSIEQLSSEEMEILVTSEWIHDIWCTIPTLFQNIHNVLSNYWKFHGHTKVCIYWPCCDYRRLPLMQFTETKVYDEFRSNCSLACGKCEKCTYVENLMPPSTVDFSKVMECLRVTSEIICPKGSFSESLEESCSFATRGRTLF